MSTEMLTITISVVVVALALLILLVASLIRRNGKVNNDQVYVGNLSYRVNEYDLKNHFGQYGEIVQARIVKNSRTGRSKGFGFITYTNSNQAKKALGAHGEDLKGRTLVVRIAKPR